MDIQEKNIDAQYPSILFKLYGTMYSVNSYYVQEILPLPASTPMPHSHPDVVGVFMFRGHAIPLTDLRAVLGFQTLEEDHEQFCNMIDQRKQDHIHWVQELDRTINANEKFTLTTDPHQCAFGQWYDNFTSDNNSVMFHLRKIKEPHDNIHKAAHDVERCRKQCDTCDRSECLKSILKRLEDKYMPIVLKLLDETKTVFEEAMHPMVIVYGEKHPIGFIVDEILSVENLEDLPQVDSSESMLSQDYVSGIKQSKHYPGIILSLNGRHILERITAEVSDDLLEAAENSMPSDGI